MANLLDRAVDSQQGIGRIRCGVCAESWDCARIATQFSETSSLLIWYWRFSRATWLSNSLTGLHKPCNPALFTTTVKGQMLNISLSWQLFSLLENRRSSSRWGRRRLHNPGDFYEASLEATKQLGRRAVLLGARTASGPGYPGNSGVPLLTLLPDFSL